MTESNGRINLFSSKREIETFDKPASIRPDFTRRIKYRGNDAELTLNEMEELYGVTPDRGLYQIETEFKNAYHK